MRIRCESKLWMTDANSDSWKRDGTNADLRIEERLAACGLDALFVFSAAKLLEAVVGVLALEAMAE